MKKCIDCIHWNSTGEQEYQGHCIISVECVNSKNHPRYLNKKDVIIPIYKPKLKHEDNIEIKTRSMTIPQVRHVMSNKELANAAENRRTQNPDYPDIRTLTDESKKKIRELKRRK